MVEVFSMKTIIAPMILCASFLFFCPSTRAQCNADERKEMAAEAELHREELVNLVRETARPCNSRIPHFSTACMERTSSGRRPTAS
jgi:hypothetical protein